MLRVTSLCGLLLTTGCANSPQATATNPVTPDGFDSGNNQVWNRSAGYSVHVLNGESLSAQEVGINGLRIDTASVQSIESSVQAIVDAPSDNTVVELAAAPVTVTPDLTVDYTGATTAVPSTFYGANVQWRSKFFISEPRWQALVKHTPIGILRFPGGQERVRYDGKDSLAGSVADDTLVVTTTQPYEYRIAGDDVARFISLCKDLGIEAEPEVNLTVDDAAMWAAFVSQIVGDLKYDLHYVSVGNEPDIKSPNGNWDVLGATGATDAARRGDALTRYTERYLTYQSAIAAVQPRLTYVFGELGGWTPDQLGPNLDVLLSGLQTGIWSSLGSRSQFNPPHVGPLLACSGRQSSPG